MGVKRGPPSSNRDRRRVSAPVRGRARLTDSANTQSEISARHDRHLSTRLKMAHLPYQKTLEQFDFDFQKSIDQRQIRELRTLRFVHEASNVIFLGPPGVGKTHLSVGLAIETARAGMGVYFITADDLIQDLSLAAREAQLQRRMRVYLRPKVLIIDKMG